MSISQKLIVILCILLCAQGAAAQTQLDEEAPQNETAWRALEMNASAGVDGIMGTNVSAGLRGGALTTQFGFGYDWFKRESVIGYQLGILPGMTGFQRHAAFMSPMLSLGFYESFPDSGGNRIISGSILIGSIHRDANGFQFSFGMGIGIRTETEQAWGREPERVHTTLRPAVRADIGYAFELSRRFSPKN